MTSRGIVDRWVPVLAPVSLVGVAVWLGVITGSPGWWMSLMVIIVVGALGHVIAWRRHAPGRRILGAVIGIAVVAVSAGAVAAASMQLRADRAVVDDRAEVRRVSGDLVCRILTRGTDADRAAALAASTGELAARLGSGSAAEGSATAGAGGNGTGTSTRCTVVRTGLSAITDVAADVVVAANLTERDGADESASGRIVAAHLARVGGAWRVSSLDLIR